ncbi:MAG: hypothetical protein CR986_02290 [Ignavibacteriae bacterium]|nr:MAG: hypothetical protein CR986_02290 [Ignavibacteriota bacterium]
MRPVFSLEKILNIIENNNLLPAVILDKNDQIISYNKEWKKIFPNAKNNLKFYELFGLNERIAIKFSLIDVRTLNKKIKTSIILNTENHNIKIPIFIFPFKVAGKKYSYCLTLIGNETSDYIAYPTLPDYHIISKAKSLFNAINVFDNYDLIQEDKLQTFVNSFQNQFGIKNKNYTITANNSLNKLFEENKNLRAKNEEILNEIFQIHSPFILEQREYLEKSNLGVSDKALILLPITSKKGGSHESILIFNKNILYENINQKSIDDNFAVTQENMNSNILNLDTDKAQISYDKNSLNIFAANETAARLYGYSLEQLKTMDVTQLFELEDLQSLLDQRDNNEIITKQKKADGTTLEVRIKREYRKIENKEIILETISPNNYEEEIIQLDEYSVDAGAEEENLEDEKSKEETKPRHKKSDFLSTLFHEILTPTNVILGFIQEIIDSIDNPSEEQIESAEIIKTNQKKLLQTMNMAVQYAELDKDNTLVEDFDFSIYITDIEESLNKFSEEKNVNILIKNPYKSVMVKHDKSRFLASISYLIRFVVQLTKTNNIYIQFEIKDENFRMLIKDNENFVSQSVADKIIKIYDEDYSICEMDGEISPIAITLSRKLNKILSAEVKISSEKEIVFFVASEFKNITKKNIRTFQQEESNQEVKIIRNDIAVNSIQDFSQSSCLLIDDSIDSGLLFKNQMKDFGHIEICTNLRKAFPLLNKHQFDYIFVDINLDDIYNGIDALKIIKQLNNYKSTPIFAITAYPFKDDKEQFINLGFANYFVKPFIREQFNNAIESITV